MMEKFFNWLQRRFQVVIVWGLSNADTPVGELTSDQIENIFCDGCATAVNDEHTGKQNPCPHAEGTLARHWWTRGYAYYWRTFLRLRAEELLKVETERAERAEGELARTVNRNAVAGEMLINDMNKLSEINLMLAEAKIMKASNAARRLVDRIVSEKWMGQPCAGVVRQQAREEIMDLCMNLNIAPPSDEGVKHGRS